MAYQTRPRNTLIDPAMQAALERRASELAGLALIAAGVALGLAIASYSPADPSFLGTATVPPENWLGHFGAYLAAPLFVILGAGSWALPAVLAVWGVRLVLHRGAERAMTRLVFAPIAVALAALYAATHPPGDGWAHSFGMGGLFGDTGLGVLLGVLPMAPAAGLKLAALGLAVALLALGLYGLGFTWSELRATAGYAAGSLRMAGARLFGGASAMLRRRPDTAPAHGRGVATPLAPAGQVMLDPQPDLGIEAPKRGFWAAMGFRRQADLEPEPDVVLEIDPIGGEDRVRARIADAIRNRLGGERGAAEKDTGVRRRAEPVVSRPGPLDAADASLPMTGASFAATSEASPPDADILPSDDMREVIPHYAERRPVVSHTVQRVAPSRQALAEAQPALALDADERHYLPPALSLLSDPSGVEKLYLSDEALEQNARMLESVLDDYGVKGDIANVRPGPVVTMYELEPAPGLKASRVVGLADDIARSMAALSARVSTVPGRSVIGIELPNERREMVLLREILATRDFGDSKLRLPLALGKNIGGEAVVANLAKMPHLLIAGTTGSGKSVAINTMILSLLYKLTPDECRLIMIDPKMLELSVYDGIPHLLSPVVTDPKKAVVALKWVVGEMEDRYRRMSKMGVRNIEGYNGRVREALDKGECFSRTVQTGFDDATGDPVFETEEFAPETLPYIVVIVDEMADLMMVAGKEIEACIQRLAQMARASGIHLIMATQRPSVDVITGTIKANFPTRISFQVTSKVDSRTILNEQGAEQLLGMGDMLYMAGGARITRIHAPFVSDEEVEEVVNHLKTYGPPDYVGSVVEGPEDEKAEDIDLVLGLGGNTTGDDALYDQAVQIVIADRKCSTSYIQRKLAIGYNKAARLVEQMEQAGLVSPANHVGKREVLVPEP